MIGVDVGGTHTYVYVATAGSISRGKSLTTHDDCSSGILGAIKVTAKAESSDLAEQPPMMLAAGLSADLLDEARGRFEVTAGNRIDEIQSGDPVPGWQRLYEAGAGGFMPLGKNG